MAVEDYIADIPPDQRHLFPPPPIRRQPYAATLKALWEKCMQHPAGFTQAKPPDNAVPPMPPGAADQGVNATADAKSSTGDKAKREENPIRTGTALRNLNYGEHLHVLMKPYVGDCGGHPAFMEIIGQIYQECGRPDDPMVKMLIPQIEFYHELIPVLYLQALNAKSPEVAKVFFAAAHRTSEDYRKAVDQLREILKTLPKAAAVPAKQEKEVEGNEAVILKPPQKSARKKTG